MTQKELGGLSDKLLEIGARNVAPLEEVPEAFNRIISAGLSVNDSLAALEPTLRAAKAGFTDIETVASAAVSTMMSSGEDVNRVYDVLFATMKVGNAEFRDIAQYLPKIIPLARNVGFALDETAGAYATLTGKLSAEQSATALQGVMRSLSSNDTVKKFKEIGVNIFDASGKARPLLDIMGDLNSQMQGLTDKQRMIKFGSLGLDQMSALGFSTLIQDMPALQNNMQEVINSQGALNKSYEDSLTPLDDFKQTMNIIKVRAIEIGQMFLPVLTAIGKGALFVAQNFDIIGGVLGGLAVAWGILNAKMVLAATIQGVLAVKTALATAAQWALNVAASANPIGLIIMLIGALVGGLVVAYHKFDKVRAIMQGSWEVIKGFGNVLKEFVIDRIKGIISGLGTLGSALGKLFKGDFSGAWDDAKKGVSLLTGVDAKKKAFESTIQLKHTFDNKYKQVLADAAKKKDSDETENKNVIVPETENEDNGNGKGMGSDVKSVSQGSQTKNITVNIDSFVKGFTPTHQSVNGMSKDELERWMTEMFLRVVRSAETAM